MTRRRASATMLALLVLSTFVGSSLPAVRAEAPSALLARADGDLASGRYDEARANYLAVATSAPDALARNEAWAGLLRVATAVGRIGEAGALGRAALRAAGVEADDRLLYLAATTARDAGDLDAAAARWRRVVEHEALLASMARLRLGQALASAGRDAEAVPALRVAASDDALTGDLRNVARDELAAALVRLGRDAAAVQALQSIVLDPQSSGAALADAHWRIAASLREDDDPAWVAHARGALTASPHALEASLALAALVEAGEPVPPLEAAYVHYLARRDAAAREGYQETLAGAPAAGDAHTAWFYLGAIEERAGHDEAAVAAYDVSLDAAPDGWLADDALWWSGLLLEFGAEPLAAADRFERLVLDFPRSPFAADATLRGPIALAEAGDFEGARARLRTLMAAGAPPDAAASAARWLTLLGDEGAPHPATFSPASLPALLADAGARATAPLPPGARLESLVPLAAAAGATSVEEAALDGWMADRFGPAPAATGAPDVRLTLMEALVGVNERAVAGGAAELSLASRQSQPHALLELARAAARAGLYDIAIAAAEGVLRPLEPAERIQAPVALLKLSYPVAFASDLARAAEIEEVPPLLLAALVRQESRFNPIAGSFAGALGLTQVIPPTGSAIAASLGVAWDSADLLRPATSLRYGAHYFSVQLEAFDGHVPAALAAYNGGPGNAARWLEAQRWPGADGYVQAIDFAETRLYLETVLENYAWYRYLYAGAPQPALW